MIPLWADANNWATLKATTNQLINLVNSMENATVPIGSILPWFGDPNNALLFDVGGVGVAGTEMDRFALCLGQGLVGSQLKNFDGTARSITPDMRGKFPAGMDNLSPKFNYIGQEGGEEDVLLTARESGLREHNHSINSNSAVGSGLAMAEATNGATPRFFTGATGVDGVAGRNGAQPALDRHNNLPPYLTTGFIIRYK